MSIFGWSLPPGCRISDLPGNQDYPCDVCLKMSDDCICPECPVCQAPGDPKCYKEHGMVVNKTQLIARAEAEVDEKKMLLKDAEMYLERVQQYPDHHTIELAELLGQYD